MNENSKRPTKLGVPRAPISAAAPLAPSHVPAPACRKDAAAALFRNRAVLRARIARAVRHMGVGIDIDNVLDSAIGHIDLVILRGTLRAESESQFWAFASAVIHHATLNHLRRARRERAFLHRECDALAVRFERCCDNDEAAALVHEVLMSLDDEMDRELVYRRLQGYSYGQIAGATAQPEAALHGRWARICRWANRRYSARA